MKILQAVSDCPFNNPPDKLQELVEIHDSFGRPLLLVSRQFSRKRQLPRRIVHVCLRNLENKILIPKRADSISPHPGLWDISLLDDVLAGESYEGAALRLLAQNLGLPEIPIKLASMLPYLDEQGGSLSAAFFLAGPCRTNPRPDPQVISDFMFLTQDELVGLFELNDNMFTPELSWAMRSGWLFK